MRFVFSKTLVHFLFVVMCLPSVWAQGVAEVAKLKGRVDVMAGQGEMRALKIGDRLNENDTVVTGNDGRVQLIFEEGGEKGKNAVVLGMNSRLKIQRASVSENDPGTKLFLEQGNVRSVVNRRYKGEGNDVFEVHTPNAVAGVRGTVFHVTYDKIQNESAVATLKGLVAVKLGYAAHVLVAPNQFTRVVQGALQNVKDIKADQVMQMRLKGFESQRFVGETAKVDSGAAAPSKNALYKSSNRTIEQRNQIERAQKISERTGVPIEKALQVVVSDGVSDGDRKKALQRLDGGIVAGTGGGGALDSVGTRTTTMPVLGDSVSGGILKVPTYTTTTDTTLVKESIQTTTYIEPVKLETIKIDPVLVDTVQEVQQDTVEQQFRLKRPTSEPILTIPK